MVKAARRQAPEFQLFITRVDRVGGIRPHIGKVFEIVA